MYDVTKFLDEHPGGMKVLLKVGGQDATDQFNMFHSPEVLEEYGPEMLIGSIGAAAAPAAEQKAVVAAVPNTFGDLVPYGDPNWYQEWESPYYNDSHRALRKAMRAFVDKEITPFCNQWDEQKKLPREIFLKAGDAGWLAALVGPPWNTEYAGKRLYQCLNIISFTVVYYTIRNYIIL